MEDCDHKFVILDLYHPDGWLVYCDICLEDFVIDSHGNLLDPSDCWRWEDFIDET